VNFSVLVTFYSIGLLSKSNPHYSWKINSSVSSHQNEIPSEWKPFSI